MSNKTIRNYYLKLLTIYSVAPTFVLISLLTLFAFSFDRSVRLESLRATLAKDKETVEQVIKRFQSSTSMVANSSLTEVALKFGDFGGYRTVVIPWIGNDESIQGFVMFDSDGIPKVSWPSGLSRLSTVAELNKRAGFSVSENMYAMSYEVFDSESADKLGSISFVTSLKALGLSHMNVVADDTGKCESLDTIDFLFVCMKESQSYRWAFSLLMILMSGAGLLLILFFSISKLATFLIAPVNSLHQGLSRIKEGKHVTWNGMFDQDSAPIFRPIGEHSSEAAFRYHELKSKSEEKSKITELARQMAHDIRSPLSALKSIFQTSKQHFPEECRDLLEMTIRRIEDIAADVLKRGRQVANRSEELEVAEINSAIREIVNEKNIQFGGGKGPIVVSSLMHDPGYVFINSVAFKRALSNLIANAIEAVGEQGVVEVQTSTQESRIIIKIIDNGVGIPPHILSNLGKAPLTTSKDGLQTGNGIGVYQAHRLFFSAQGSIRFESLVGKGTTVTIDLPEADKSSLDLYLFRPQFDH